MSKPQHVNDADFEKEVLQAEMPVVVDFWAEWCGPCKQVAPFLDDLAKEKDGVLKVVKVDIDNNPQTPTTYNVRGIPTLMVFRNGALVATKVGALPRSALYEWVESSLQS